MRPPNICIVYAHEDAQQKEELAAALAVMRDNKEIDIWHDNEMLPGDRWCTAIKKHIDTADILLYLVSAHSLASTACNSELTGVMRQNMHIIPIILEPCDWRRYPIAGTDVLPLSGKALSAYKPRSRGWQEVAEGIRRCIHTMAEQEAVITDMLLQFANFRAMLNQTAAAIEVYNHIIAEDPRHVAAYNNRGIAIKRSGNLKQAIDDLTTVISLDPQMIDAYNNRGTTWGMMGKYTKAMADFTAAIDIDPYHATAYANRGFAKALVGKHAAAIIDYNKAIAINPQMANTYHNRGHAHFDIKQYTEAVADFNTAIALDPQMANAYYSRGLVNQDIDKHAKAIVDFSKAIALNPQMASAYGNRGCSNRCLDKHMEAIADLTKAISIEPQMDEAYYIRALANYEAGNYPEAIADFNTVLRVDSRQADAAIYRGRGAAHAALQQWTQARADLQRAYDMSTEQGDDVLARDARHELDALPPA